MSAILLVDDSPVSRDLLSLQLERLGHKVETAACADEAIMKMSSVRPDVILLDLLLPDFEQAKRVIRHLETIEGIEPKVIITTGLIDDRAASWPHVIDIMFKPFSAEDVQNKLVEKGITK